MQKSIIELKNKGFDDDLGLPIANSLECSDKNLEEKSVGNFVADMFDLERVEIAKSELKDIVFQNGFLFEVKIIDSSIFNLRFLGSSLNNCELENCRINMVLDGATLEDVIFRNCEIDCFSVRSSVYHGRSILENVTFTKCRIGGLSIGDGVVLQICDIPGFV